MRISLDGEWKLYLIPPDSGVETPDRLQGNPCIPGHVPGNLELDLFHNGFGGDPFIGENANEYRKYGNYDFWYVKEFQTESPGKWDLVLEGADCFTEIFLNGEKSGSSENALIPHRFTVDLEQNNILAIRILSAEIAARKYPEDAFVIAHFPPVYSSAYCRKPAHCTGWDILPWLSLGGLWKSVFLEKEASPFAIRDLWAYTRWIDKESNSARIRMFYSLSAGKSSLAGCELIIRGTCKNSTFVQKTPAYFTYGVLNIDLPSPELWNPRGYGEPNLYDLTAELCDPDGTVLAEYHTSFGVRTAELERTETNFNGEGEFLFRINGTPVRILGCNHVPFDALHSRDPERMERTLALFDEMQCNMIRCWGGGVYESDAFYDFCDRRGILVWQDFMFACGAYPQNETFFDLVRPEAESVVKRLRRHPSLVLWCGDNECDQSMAYEGLSLKNNRLNREILPGIVARHDPSRPYLESSPYFKAELQEKYSFDEIAAQLPEVHLWGTRETFKMPYYSEFKSKFISESGWHGAPALSSIKKFLSPEHFVLDEDDPEWDFHASNPFGKESVLGYRRHVIGNQIRNYFTVPAQSVEDYVKKSQIFQAEAIKFLLETARLKPGCNGIIWWNMIDGWPQFSDSVVDYYYRKKLAFFYAKRCHSPFYLCMTEPDFWENTLVALNDSCNPVSGTFTVEKEDRTMLLSGSFELPPFLRKNLGKITTFRGVNELYLIKWEINGVRYGNHYISGNTRMEPDWYLSRLPVIAALDNSFDPDTFWL